MQKWFTIFAAAIVLSTITTASPAQVMFSAMGDVPYTPAEAEKLPRQIAEIDPRSAFLIHLGDIKSQRDMRCQEATYINVASLLKRSAKPVFIIPGDNEWNDCDVPGRAWGYWAKYFMRFDQNWPHSFNVVRQTRRPENFAFVHDRALFLGLNMVGGRLNLKDEWKQRLVDNLSLLFGISIVGGQVDAEDAWERRLADNLTWTATHLERFRNQVSSAVILGHAFSMDLRDIYFDGLMQAAKAFGKPILYLHGDGHHWLRDHPFEAKNILRVQVERGGRAPPISVTVTHDPATPFLIDRRKPDP